MILIKILLINKNLRLLMNKIFNFQNKKMKFLQIKREVSFKNLKIQAPRQVKKKIALHMSLNSAKNTVMRMSIKF